MSTPRPERLARRAVRDRCRDYICRYLRQRARLVDVCDIAPIHLALYGALDGEPRWRALTIFLMDMEKDGLIWCTYRRIPGAGRRVLTVQSVNIER